MTNRLLSLIFDPQTFDIAPNYDEWAIAETDDRIVLTVSNMTGRNENFEVKFQGIRSANVKGLPEGDYRLHACLLDGPDKHKICFAFYSADNWQEVDRIIFDQRMYLETFMEASASHSLTSQFDAKQFERQFGVNYLMGQFGHRIEGHFDFWQMLEEDIDMVTTPISHAIVRENGSLPKKPYYISFNGSRPICRI